MKVLFLVIAFTFFTACSHPLEIVGQGDIVSATGDRDCLYEEYQAGAKQCAKNFVIGKYQETYSAKPRDGWEFLGWENCLNQFPDCALNVEASRVKENWFKTMPPLRAVFSELPQTSLNILSVFPSKVFASDGQQRIVAQVEGFSSTDEVFLADLSDPDTVSEKVPVWLDEDAGLLVIQANFSSTPSRWVLSVSRQDDSETDSIFFDVVDELDETPFLASPVDDSDCSSHPCNPYELNISVVMDHSGTPLDPINGGCWYSSCQDQKVEAFTGEVGIRSAGWDGDSSFPGYKNISGEDFVVNGFYTGVSSTGPDYLNYDGHSGYDYPYGAGATIVAPDDGYLFRARTDSVNSALVNPAWEEFHAFYIVHANGMTTWFLHAQALDPAISSKLGDDVDQPIWVTRGQVLGEPSNYCDGCTLGAHLHFEVRRGEHEVVDPYGEKLWEGLEILLTLKTNYGDISLQLDPEKAPKTVANFIAYAHDGFYNGTIFHRVIDGFMIQGGGFEPGMNQKPTGPPIRNEAENGLKNERGTVAMARTADPHSATAQFFINVNDNNFLNDTATNWGYAVFGRVVDGMDVVDSIRAVATGTTGFYQDVPLEDVVIESVEIVEED